MFLWTHKVQFNEQWALPKHFIQVHTPSTLHVSILLQKFKTKKVFSESQNVNGEHYQAKQSLFRHPNCEIQKLYFLSVENSLFKADFFLHFFDGISQIPHKVYKKTPIYQILVFVCSSMCFRCGKNTFISILNWNLRIKHFRVLRRILWTSNLLFLHGNSWIY